MKVTAEQKGDVTIVLLSGAELDANTASEFKREVGQFLTPGSKIVFDMEQLGFVDSSGLGALLSCLRHLNSTGGDLKLCAMTKPVQSLFELVRMHRIFNIYPTKEEAVQAFEK